MGISLTGAIQFWIPTVLVCAVLTLVVRRKQRTPGLLQASSMAVLSCVAFLNAVTAWVLGLSRNGLDLRESCEQKAGTFDDAWHDAHDAESQKFFPLHAKCGATVDLVPAWVNPAIVVLLLLSAAGLCAAVGLGVRSSSRRRKKAHA